MRSGALVLADSYQAIGALEIDVRTLGADVVTGGTVKYLLGSAGLGVHVAARLASLAAPADADRLVRRRGHLRDVDRRLLAARDRAALRQRHAAGAVALSRGRRDGADRRGRRSRDRGARPRRSSTGSSPASTSSAPRSRRRAATTSTARSSASSRRIRTRSSTPSPPSDIVTSTRDSNLRISLHLYNVEEDVDRILAALSSHRELLA